MDQQVHVHAADNQPFSSQTVNISHMPRVRQLREHLSKQWLTLPNQVHLVVEGESLEDEQQLQPLANKPFFACVDEGTVNVGLHPDTHKQGNSLKVAGIELHEPCFDEVRIRNEEKWKSEIVAQGSNPVQDNKNGLLQLIGMGFDPQVSESILAQAGGDINIALQMLGI